MEELHLTFHFSSLTVLAFHVFLTHICKGQSKLISSSQPIVATLGGDVVLPCHLQPAEDVTDWTLEWTRPDLEPRFVYVWRSQRELVSKKHVSFQGRTSLFINELMKGNISLKLSKVKLSDEGKYRCFIPSPEKETFVQLRVVSAPVSSPVISLSGMDRDRGGVVLQCESRGWYPEPEVLWLDAEGNLLSAGPPETVRGPDDLYTVSSRVTVDKRHNNSFTCRVQQNNIHQTREAHIHVPDDFFLSSSSSAVPINTGLAVSLAVSIMVILAGVFFVWRQNRTKTKKRSRDEAEKDKLLGETKDLIEKYEKIEEELQKTKEELKNKTEEVDKLTADNKKLEEENEQLQKIKAELENQVAASKNSFLSWLSPNPNKQQKKEVEPVKQEQEIHQQEAEVKWREISEELKEKRAELETKTVDLDQTKKHADELLAENKKLEQEAWQLQEENKAIRMLKDVLTDKLEKQIKHGKDQAEKYLKEIEEVTKKNKEWEMKLKEEEMKRESAEKELEQLRKKLDIKEIHQQEAEMKRKEINEELEKQRVELENKTVALDQTKRHADELLAENKKHEQEIWKLQQENKSIRMIKAMMDNKLEEQINQKEKYLKEIEEVTNKNKEWEKKLKEEEMKTETAEKELEELRRKLNIKSERIKPEQTQNSSSSDSQETLGDITVVVNAKDYYICLRNKSDQDKPLGGRQLKVQINNSEPITYTFDPSMKLKAGKSVTIHHPDSEHIVSDSLVWMDVKSWKSGDRVQVSLQ